MYAHKLVCHVCNNEIKRKEKMMSNFDPNKTYTIGVWDMTYYVYDDEADDYVRNEDGSVKDVSCT